MEATDSPQVVHVFPSQKNLFRTCAGSDTLVIRCHWLAVTVNATLSMTESWNKLNGARRALKSAEVEMFWPRER